MSFVDLQNFSTPPKRVCGAPNGSILQAFPPKPIAPHDRLGYSYRGEPCNGIEEYDPDVCVAPSGFPKMTPDEFGGEKDASLVVVQAAFKCSTVGATDEELRRHARNAIERNLWRSVDTNLTALLVAGGPAALGGPFTPVCGLAEAAQYLATNSYCGTGIIYGGAAWFAQLSNTLIMQQNGLFTDLLGNIVIPSSVDTDSVYAFDSEIEVRTSEIQLLDEYSPGIRTVNDRVVRAELTYTVAVDNCSLGVLTVDPCA